MMFELDRSVSPKVDNTDPAKTAKTPETAEGDVNAPEIAEANVEAPEESAEQSPEDISKLNDDARIEIKKGMKAHEELKGKIDNLLTTIDISSSRKGKTYKGFDGIKKALEDATAIVGESANPAEGLADASNNILDSTKQRMEIIVRDAGDALDHVLRAQDAHLEISNESGREGNVQPEWSNDVVSWKEQADEVLLEIQKIKDNSGVLSAREAANTAASEAGW